MFDTMTLTKIVGAFCGSLLVFLFANWAAESIYHVGGGHGDAEAAYVIETDAGDGGDGGDAAAVDFPTLMASADPAKGERLWSKCRACHKLDGNNATGPHLDGVVGRGVDMVDGFAYSGALEKVAEVWTEENLFHFLESPKGFAPGTKMTFTGLPKAEDRVNLIAYLATQQ